MSDRVEQHGLQLLTLAAGFCLDGFFFRARREPAHDYRGDNQDSKSDGVFGARNAPSVKRGEKEIIEGEARQNCGHERWGAPEEIGDGHHQQDEKKCDRGLIENFIQAI